MYFFLLLNSVAYQTTSLFHMVGPSVYPVIRLQDFSETVFNFLKLCFQE